MHILIIIHSKTHQVCGLTMALEALQQALLKPVQLQMLWSPPQISTCTCKAAQYCHNTVQVCLMSQSWDNVASMYDHLIVYHAETLCTNSIKSAH